MALIFMVALVTVISGCCVRFSDLTPGTKYNVGATITSSGRHIKVEQFQWSNGNWTNTGFAEVDTQGGSNNNMHTNNVNLNFIFDYPVDEITLRYGEYGGNNNIKVNNDFKNVPDIIDLNGTTLGGVQVTVNAAQQGGNWFGMIILEGTINNFSIGGQELWVDDVCRKK